MAVRHAGAAALDASAITLSGLCLIHCLALPLVAAFLPVAGVLADAEWVHRTFVAAAVPISVFAILRSWNHEGGTGFAVFAVAGLGLLVAAAFIEALHDHETSLTVIGAVLLASAHVWRWTRHARCACDHGPG